MKNILLLISFFTINFIISQTVTDFIEASDNLFKTYVKNGLVDYAAIKKDPAKLNAALAAGKDVKVSTSNENDFKAFWINAYNVGLISEVVKAYPVKTPLKIIGLFKSKKLEFGGKTITLDAIENKVLRGNFPKESRIHFALVCGGLGCPPIISEAYKPSTLDAQLNRQAKAALNDPNFVRVDGKKVKLSQIFNWYKGDFTQGGNSLIDYVNKFRKTPLTATKVSYYEYDWTLNDIN